MAEIPEYCADEIELRAAINEGWHKDKVAQIVAKYLRSGKPLSQPFRDLVADWVVRKPKPHVKGENKGQKRKKQPTEWLEIGTDFLIMQSLGCSDTTAYRLLAQGYGVSKKTIERTIVFYRQAAEKLETE